MDSKTALCASSNPAPLITLFTGPVHHCCSLSRGSYFLQSDQAVLDLANHLPCSVRHPKWRDQMAGVAQSVHNLGGA